MDLSKLNMGFYIRCAIWESEEDFKNYVQNRLMPVIGKLAKGEPKIEIIPLHTLFIP